MHGDVKHAAGKCLLLLLGLLAPAIAVGQPKVKIATTTLPSGTVSVSYSQALSTTGGKAPYTWSLSAGALPGGLSLNGGGTISGIPTTGGTFQFTVKVVDGAGDPDEKPLTISVPVITTGTLPNAIAGSSYSATLAASDAVPPVTWTISVGALPSGLSLAPSTGIISGAPAAAGTTPFTVRLADNRGGVATKALSLTINPALSITTASLPAGSVGAAYSQALAASGGLTPYTWTVSLGTLPAGLSLAAGGTISGTPGSAGPSNFTVKVTDGAGGSITKALSLTINPALTITTASLPAGIVGNAYSQALAASGGSAPYTWTVSAGTLPSGLSLAAGGAISGTPGSAGSSNFTVKVTDSANGSTTKDLSLTINPALTITTASLPAGTVGTAYSQALVASGGLAPYTWAVTVGTLPSGFSLSAGGTISGTPGSAGSTNFTVKVTDSANGSTTKALSLTINPALTITTASLPAGTVGTAYSQALAASGGAAPYTWTVSLGTLPAGLSLSAGGTISGTPGSAGSSNFTVKVTDSASVSTTAALSLTINPALAITTASLPAGTVGTAYSQALAASGGSAPYTWTVSLGTLPAGLSLSAGGTISGTPGTAGSSNFTVKVTDSASVSTTAQLSLTINPPALSITTSSLAAGTVGTAYSQALGASGGSPPYSWTVSAGTLPPGLGLSAGGTISGTPGTPGTSNFTVKVTDSASGSITKVLSLTINPPALSITTSSLPAGTVEVAYSQVLAASGGSPPYSWTVASGSLPPGFILAANGTISGVTGTPGPSTFAVRVTDSASVSVTAPLSITITLPSLRITTSSLPAGIVGAAYSQALGASGGEPPYSWSFVSGSLPTGLNLAPGGTISGTPGSAGSSNFTVRVTDRASNSTTAMLSVTINPPVLTITTSLLPAGIVGVAYSQTLGAAGGSPPYSWSIAGGSLPAGLSMATGGTISGTPGTVGASSFTVRVTDSSTVSTTAALSLTINPPTLSITTSSLPPGMVGTTYSQALAAAGGSPPYAWSISSGALPSGLILSAGGSVSGTPTNSGPFSFSVQVTDSVGSKTTSALAIQVQPPAVQIITSSLPAYTAGTNYTQTLTAAGGTPPFTWSVVSGSLPPGLELESGGTIRGTAAAAGSYTFSVRVTDRAGAIATRGYSVTINGAVIIETNSLADALIGASYSQPLRADAGTPPYAWSLTSGAMPDGITLNSTGSLSGTPTAVGSFGFTLRVVDAARAFADRQFQIITAAGLIITTAPVLPPATVGLQYGQSLDAAGGRPPYVWSISSGGLPAGVTLNPATGALAGVPSAAGAFQFTVDVSDSLARKASKQFSLPVAAALGISSAPALPGAIAGVAYSQVLAATGGTPPYLWNITEGGLPAGLSFDAGTAKISGIPTLGGSFTFAAQVSDNNSVTATKQFTLAVTSNLTITTTSPLPDATVSASYARSLNATGGIPPYVWTVKSGSLPPGLALDPAGNSIAGTPVANGNFIFNLQVVDASGGSATRDYSLAVSLPTLPAISMDGLPDSPNAADQPSFSVSLATPYPVQLTGQIVATFAADAEIAIDDAAIQFPTGGRTVNFTIPAGSTTALFSTSQMALQTGTVAGTITLTLSLQSVTAEMTAASTRTLRVLRAAPVMRGLQVVHTSGGFELRLTAYSTPRQLTQAVVQLTPVAGSNLQTTQLNIPLTDLAATWYKSAASSAFGSQFTLTLPFTIQGDATGISSVSVSLVNSLGSSPAVSAKF